jgi:mannobiose 2-epimerase
LEVSASVNFRTSFVSCFSPALLLAAILLSCILPTQAATLKELALEQRTLLTEKVLPYWFDTAQDTRNGGYLLADDVKGRGTAREKQLVSQSRMIWGFSHAHRKGFSTTTRNYLQAAAQGYRFLLSHFKDPKFGGYYWKTDLSGQPTDQKKILYGESFVIYALVEYHRASGDPEPLHEALDLFLKIHGHCHDSAHGGWTEHCERNWAAIPGDETDTRMLEVEYAGLKSANAHLHWMEALSELYDVTRDGTVRSALKEALHINATVFYPQRPALSRFHARPDLTPLTEGPHAGLSYGHNVEFAWLMVRAEEALGVPRSWKHFDAILDHALAHGWDSRNGGLYNRGVTDEPANDTQKVWWVQSEMLAALVDSLRRGPNPDHAAALYHQMDFINRYMANPSDGIWIESTTAEGRPMSTAKAHNWKANYHDVRALVKFIDAYSVSSGQ